VGVQPELPGGGQRRLAGGRLATLERDLGAQQPQVEARHVGDVTREHVVHERLGLLQTAERDHRLRRVAGEEGAPVPRQPEPPAGRRALERYLDGLVVAAGDVERRREVHVGAAERLGAAGLACDGDRLAQALERLVVLAEHAERGAEDVEREPLDLARAGVACDGDRLAASALAASPAASQWRATAAAAEARLSASSGRSLRTRAQAACSRRRSPGSNFRVGGLAHELVAEREPAARPCIGGEQVVRDGRAQRGGELGGGKVHERGEQIVVDARAGGGGGAQHRLRGGRQRGDPHAEQVADGGRQGRLVAAGVEQLLGQERVAARAARDRGGGDRIRRGAGDGGQQLGDLRPAERVELDPPHPVRARKLGQPGTQPRSAGRLVAAVRGHQRDPLVPQRAGEVRGQVERRAVGPVHVLEHEQQRRRRGRLGEQIVRLAEQPRPRRRVGAHARAGGARQQGRQLGRGAGAHALPGALPEYVIRPMWRRGGARSVAGRTPLEGDVLMKTIVAVLVAVALLAVAAPAGARPVDAYGPIPSTERPAVSPSSGTEPWAVIAAAVLAFAAGAGAARLAPVVRPRVLAAGARRS